MSNSRYLSNRVFTPTSPAISTFVERAHKINNHLVDALNTPGKQIVMYGHSGCGKTTLLTNKLSQTYKTTFVTRCMAGMSFESILLDGFDQLGAVYTESVKSSGFKISPSIMINYNDIRATLNIGDLSKLNQTSTKFVLPPQLTPQRLAKFFGESKSCWVIEDFHKIKGAEKSKTSQLMKVFMDMSVDYPDLKLIAIGAVGSARQVIEYDKEMNNRISEISIPYMQTEEIKEIINTGESLLNIRFSNETKERIVRYSCGLPSVCHQLCLNICFQNGIYETSKTKISINVDSLDSAIEKYVEEKSDTLKAEFDRSIKIANNTTINFPKEILRACLKLKNDEFSFDDIYNKINKKKRKDEIERVLGELCLPKRSEILVYDDNSNMYRFNNLFLKAYALLHFRDHKEESVPQANTNSDMKIVARLLDIIDNNLTTDDPDFYIEDDI